MNKKGFTLVELLLATALFSFVLLFVTAAFVQVSRAYNKGIIVKRTQETARSVIQEMSRALNTATSGQNTTDAVISFSNNPDRRLCVGDLRFGWNEGFRPDTSHETYSNGNNFALVRSDSGSCSDDFDQNQSVEMIDERLIVQDIQINEILAGSVYNLCVIITVNNDDDVDEGNCANNNTRCNVLAGDTYCDVARLDTTVTLRR